MGTASPSRDAITLWILNMLCYGTFFLISDYTFANSNLFYRVCVFAKGCVTTNKFMRCLWSSLWDSAPGISLSALQLEQPGLLRLGK